MLAWGQQGPVSLRLCVCCRGSWARHRGQLQPREQKGPWWAGCLVESGRKKGSLPAGNSHPSPRTSQRALLGIGPHGSSRQPSRGKMQGPASRPWPCPAWTGTRGRGALATSVLALPSCVSQQSLVTSYSQQHTLTARSPWVGPSFSVQWWSSRGSAGQALPPAHGVTGRIWGPCYAGLLVIPRPPPPSHQAALSDGTPAFCELTSEVTPVPSPRSPGQKRVPGLICARGRG